MAKQTPVENILYDCSGLKSRGAKLCHHNRIETAEQLSTYSRFAFRVGGNSRFRHMKKENTKTLDYLEECLKRVNLSFSPESPQAEGRWPGYRIYGRENAKKDLLTTMEKIGKNCSISQIAHYASKMLRDQLEPYEYYNNKPLLDPEKFAHSVFSLKIIEPYFSELVNEGKAEKIETTEKTFYKAKEQKSEK